MSKLTTEKEGVAKRAYHSPVLAEFGSVSDLTAGGTSQYPLPPWLCDVPGEGGLS
jgi:hypothetical protein